MPVAKPIIAIQFDYRSWDEGFFVTFKVPFTEEAYEAVLQMRNSANITLIK